tara:strand:- start:2306 stop:3367 length:1062 start_codon:yes stop_codon:yes gene_type:complete
MEDLYVAVMSGTRAMPSEDQRLFFTTERVQAETQIPRACAKSSVLEASHFKARAKVLKHHQRHSDLFNDGPMDVAGKLYRDPLVASERDGDRFSASLDVKYGPQAGFSDVIVSASRASRPASMELSGERFVGPHAHPREALAASATADIWFWTLKERNVLMERVAAGTCPEHNHLMTDAAVRNVRLGPGEGSEYDASTDPVVKALADDTLRVVDSECRILREDGRRTWPLKHFVDIENRVMSSSDALFLANAVGAVATSYESIPVGFRMTGPSVLHFVASAQLDKPDVDDARKEHLKALLVQSGLLYAEDRPRAVLEQVAHAAAYANRSNAGPGLEQLGKGLNKIVRTMIDAV